MKSSKMVITYMMGLMVIAAGCSDRSLDPETPPATGTSSGDATFVLKTEPPGAQPVTTVRDSASDKDDVVIVGRIGGSENPWVEGMAAFSIVDQSLKACSDIEGDNCETPWDYCCETDKLKDATVLVKLVDEGGSVINTDARQLLDVKELATVVVHGKAKRDEAGNLTVLATGVHVRDE